MTSPLIFALAPAGTYVIKNDAVANAEQAVSITEMHITAGAAGSLTIGDGSTTYTIYVGPGVWKFCFPLNFKAGANVTFTAVTASISVFGEYKYKK